MAQPVETATGHRHTHKYLGLIMVKVRASADGRTDGRTDGQTDRRTLPNVLSPLASRSITRISGIVVRSAIITYRVLPNWATSINGFL